MSDAGPPSSACAASGASTEAPSALVDKSARLIDALGTGVVSLRDTFLPPALRHDSTTVVISSELAAAGGPTPIAHPAHTPSTWQPAGYFLRVPDDVFLDVVLRLPLASVATPGAMAALLCPSNEWPTKEARLGPLDLELPAPCTSDLLPALARPTFEDFFRFSADTLPGVAPGQGAALAGQKRQRSAEAPAPSIRHSWPATFTDYYFSMTVLLMEEARAALASGAQQALEQRRRLQGGNQTRGVGGAASSVGLDEVAATPQLGMLELVSISGTPCDSAEDGTESDSEGVPEVDDGVMQLDLSLRDFPRTAAPARERLPTPRASALLGMSRDAVLLRVVASDGGAECLAPLLGVTMPSVWPTVRVRIMASRGVATLLNRTLKAHVDKGKSASGARISPCPCIVAKLDSLVSVALAFASLATIAYTPFAGLVLRPQTAATSPFFRSLGSLGDHDTLNCPAAMPTSIFDALRQQYNPSQLAAILAVVSGGSFVAPGVSIDESGVFLPVSQACGAEITTLIGPPGTGKSFTILGMISALRGTLMSTVNAQVVPHPALVPRCGTAAIAPRTVSTRHELLSSDDDSDFDADLEAALTISRVAAAAPAGAAGTASPVVIDLTDSPPALEDGLPANMSSVIDLVSSDDEDDPGGAGLSRPAAHVVPAAAPPLSRVNAASRSEPSVPLTASAAAQPVVAVSSAETAAKVHKRGQAPRFLVCAPSNVACDHLVALLLGLPSDEQRADQLVAQLVPGSAAAAAAGGFSAPAAIPTALRKSLPAQWQAPEASRGGLIGSDGKPWRPNVVRVGAGSLAAGRQEIVQRSFEYCVHRRFRRVVCDEAAKDVLSAPVANAAPPRGAQRSRFADEGAIAAAQETARSSQKRVLEEMEACAGRIRGLLDAQSAASVSRHSSPDPEHLRALLLQHARLQFEAEDLAADCAFLGACRVLIGRGASDLALRGLQLAAALRVMQEADVVVATLAGSSSLAMLRLHPVLQVSLVSEAKSRRAADGGPANDQSSVIPAERIASALRFDAILVDEAGQCTEPEILTPLRFAYAGYGLRVERTRGTVGCLRLPVKAGFGSLRRGGSNSVPPCAVRQACSRLVLVGDPLQLPATVRSQAAMKAGLDISLFERLASAGIAPLLLRTQYRMHSAIAGFSSAHFYRGLVRNAAPGDHSGAAHSPSSSTSSGDPCASAVVVVDVPWGVEDRAGAMASQKSWGNDAEVAVVVALLEHINSGFGRMEFPPSSLGKPVSVGVITPYSEQARRIRRGVSATLRLAIESRDSAAAAGRGGALEVGARSGRIGRLVVSTVDSFQGSEMDVIILSCVRSSALPAPTAGASLSDARVPGGIGFLANPRRLNVAITRARHGLFLVGNLRWLSACDDTWRALVQHARRVGVSVPLLQGAHAGPGRESRLLGGSGADSAVSPCPALQSCFHRAAEFFRGRKA